MKLTDEQMSDLMAAAQKGDHNAYRKLLKAVLPLVRKVVHERWKGRRDMVEDIVQDVLLAVHNSRHTYDPRLPLKPWLYAVTRYRVIEAIRSFKRKQGLEVYEEADTSFETFLRDETKGIGERLEDRDLLKKAMARLPSKQREAVNLVKLQGLSFAEAAQKTGYSVAALKVNAHRAYKSLKEILEGDLR